MSKELEAFIRIKHSSKRYKGRKEDLDTIFTTLKNYEELTSKPVILYGRAQGYTQKLIDYICKNYKEVKITNLEDEKKVKASEIIKRKGIDINALRRANNCAEYNSTAKSCIGYTQEDYDLLIEVML